MPSSSRRRYDTVVVGGGHNGLTCAAYLARAGQSVLVLERSGQLGGAARSARVFQGHDVAVSKYAYLVSLLPAVIIAELDLDVTLRRRRVASYTPVGDGGVLVDSGDPRATTARLGCDAAAWEAFGALTAGVARRVFPTLLEPLVSRDRLRARIADDAAWDALFVRPIGEVIEDRFTRDVVRGIVLTDALIGTFAHAHDPTLLANRCFLYHVIGGGTGHWDVPVGGMGAVSAALARAAMAAGAEIQVGQEVVAVATDGESAEVRTADGGAVEAGRVAANVAPTVLARLLGDDQGPGPEGAQLKVNMLLRRLPALRDRGIASERAFAGTFHVNQGYAELERAYRQAAAGAIPDVPPCEVYCHTLTDPTILSAELQAEGAHTLTLFGLHMPARLFREDPHRTLARAREATLASLDAVLAEPIEACLYDESSIEVMGPLEIEADLGMPGGHIFHGELQWPWAERPEEVGRWGVETAHANVVVCGAGARRGGGVSGIPGRNAAMALLAPA